MCGHVEMLHLSLVTGDVNELDALVTFMRGVDQFSQTGTVSAELRALLLLVRLWCYQNIVNIGAVPPFATLSICSLVKLLGGAANLATCKRLVCICRHTHSSVMRSASADRRHACVRTVRRHRRVLHAGRVKHRMLEYKVTYATGFIFGARPFCYDCYAKFGR